MSKLITKKVLISKSYHDFNLNNIKDRVVVMNAEYLNHTPIGMWMMYINSNHIQPYGSFSIDSYHLFWDSKLKIRLKTLKP